MEQPSRKKNRKAVLAEKSGLLMIVILIFVLIKKEIFLCGIIRPNILDAFINISFILYLLEILQYFEWGT